MNKNILKLFAILMLCFALVSVLVACGEGAEGPQGPAGKSPYVGDNGTLWYYDDAAGKYVDSGLKVEGQKGDKGDDGEDLDDCAGHVWSEHVIELSKHELVNAETGEATIGVSLQTCTLCGDAYWTEVKHDYVAGTPVAPTCTEDGYTVYTCACGHSYENDKVDALDHAPAVEFNAENVDTTVWTKSPSIDDTICDCIEEPVYTAKCVRCDYEFQKTGNAEGHHWGTERPSENTSNTPACLWSRPWIAECEVCTGEHPECLKVVREEDPADHNYVEKVTLAPTCTTPGVKTYTCSMCNGSYTEEIPALNHDLVNHEAKAPTCTEIGWDAYDTCSRCDYTTYVAKNANGHTYTVDSKKNETPASLTADGKIEFICDVCEVVAYTETLPMITDENCGENGCYTKTTTEGLCEDKDDVYTYTVTIGEAEYKYTFTLDGEYKHSDVPAESEWRLVEGKECNYWVYKCENCGLWIVVGHQEKSETPATPVE